MSRPSPPTPPDRSYLRLHRADGATAILMQAPVATSDAAARQFAAFRRVGDWLRGRGLAAPTELAAESAAGLLLLEDLGEVPDCRRCSTGARRTRGKPTAPSLSVLLRLAEEPGPDWNDGAGRDRHGPRWST